MKTIIGVVLAVGALACLAAMQSSMDQDITKLHEKDEQITSLRKQLADLSLRCSRLEHAAGTTPGAVDDSHGNASTDNVPRSMVVGGINQAGDRPMDQGQVDDLTQDAESLQQTANYHLDEADRAGGDTYYNVGGSYSDGHTGYNHSNAGREMQQEAQHQMANRYATEASIKRQKAARLEAAATNPRQLIHGHDGDVIFTLRTVHNLSLDLEKINIGDTVTWQGRRVSADSTSETWEISSIRMIKRK